MIEALNEAGLTVCQYLDQQHTAKVKEKPKIHGDSEFLRILDEMRELHIEKSKDYGSDEDALANLRGSADVGIEPWRAAWLRALDKVRRINRYCTKGSLANEGVEDSFKDLAAYSLLALRLFRETKA